MSILPRPLLVGSSALLLVLAACGQEPADSGALPAPVDSAQPAGDDGELAPPVPVRVTGRDGDAPATQSVEVSDAAIEPSIGAYPAPVEIVYEVPDDVGPLPSNTTAWSYPAGAEPTAAQLDALRTAFGVQGEAVGDGGDRFDGWRIGPDDGTAASIRIAADGMLSWYYERPWSDDVAVPAIACEVAPDGSESCEPFPGGAEPPANVPDEPQATELATALAAALGVDTVDARITVHADEWSAFASVEPRLDGVVVPGAGLHVSFGADAEIQHASGQLASPIPAGPYPLVGLDQALERLHEQAYGWQTFTQPGSPELAIPVEADGGIGDGATPLPAPGAPSDQETGFESEPPVETLVEAPVATVVPSEQAGDQPVDAPVRDVAAPETIRYTIVAVEADLWWAWDGGTTWLLPAFAFVDAEGGRHVVPAVTDEFLIVVEPEPVPLPEPVPEPLPEPVPGEPPVGQEPGDVPGDVPVEPIPQDEADTLVGMTEAEAEDTALAAGWEFRVAARDGEHFALTEDLRPNRVNVVVDGGIVTSVEVW